MGYDDLEAFKIKVPYPVRKRLIIEGTHLTQELRPFRPILIYRLVRPDYQFSTIWLKHEIRIGEAITMVGECVGKIGHTFNGGKNRPLYVRLVKTLDVIDAKGFPPAEIIEEFRYLDKDHHADEHKHEYLTGIDP